MFKVNASLIRRLMFERDISGVFELARKAQINDITLAKILKGNATAGISTIAALAKFFDVNGEELILKDENH